MQTFADGIGDRLQMVLLIAPEPMT